MKISLTTAVFASVITGVIMIGDNGFSSELPATLPVDTGEWDDYWYRGNNPVVENMITNGNCTISMGFSYTRPDPDNGTTIYGTTVNSNFDSYTSFRDHINNLANSFADELSTQTNIASEVSLSLRVYVDDPRSCGTTKYLGLSIDQNVGNADWIYRDVFMWTRLVASRLIIPLTNFYLKIQVNADAPILITNNFAEIDETVLCLTNRVRYTAIGPDGETVIYTRVGSRLKPPVIRQNYWFGEDYKYGYLTIAMTRGSDTVVESSTNLVDWETLIDFPWQWTSYGSSLSESYYGYGSVPDLDTEPKRFFRAYSR